MGPLHERSGGRHATYQRQAQRWRRATVDWQITKRGRVTYYRTKSNEVFSDPDLLRLVPGMQVARINAHTWAVGACGFNGRFSNKLLVLIEGRTVYTSLFSGVYWDAQDLIIEDIDRIEVIRGPGASLWGANAVNDVINIITKSAAGNSGPPRLIGGRR